MTGWKFHHLKRYSLLKMGDFPGCHVSFQGWTRMSQEPSKRLGSVGYFTPTKTPFIGRLKKPFTNHVMMTSWNIPSMSTLFETEKKSWPNWSHISAGNPPRPPVLLGSCHVLPAEKKGGGHLHSGYFSHGIPNKRKMFFERIYRSWDIWLEKKQWKLRIGSSSNTAKSG